MKILDKWVEYAGQGVILLVALAVMFVVLAITGVGLVLTVDFILTFFGIGLLEHSQ
jgi:hypothetical protein